MPFSRRLALQPHMQGCSECHVRSMCLPAGLGRSELERFERHLMLQRRKVTRGERLFTGGDAFVDLFAVWTGTFKISVALADGREQVTGFLCAGELAGLDGISTRSHAVEVVALEDAQVCVIRFALLESLALDMAALQKQLHRAMSHEIVHKSELMLLLGRMNFEERLVAFLLDLSRKQHARGFSATTLMLRMSRREIGSYLGVNLETVSRTLSRLQSKGLLLVREREIHLRDPSGLRKVLEPVD